MTDHDDSSLNRKAQEAANKYGITIPSAKSIAADKVYNAENLIDYEELHHISKAIAEARVSIFTLTTLGNKYDAKLAKAQATYERAWRREYVKSTAKTDTARKTEADIACEELEDEVIALKQAKNSIKSIMYALKMEMNSLQTLSSNARQQMNLH